MLTSPEGMNDTKIIRHRRVPTAAKAQLGWHGRVPPAVYVLRGIYKLKMFYIKTAY